MDTNTTNALLQIAALAADGWAIDNIDTPMTQAERTRGLVDTAVMHLIEQGLLVPAADLAVRLAGPVSVRRRPQE